MRCTIAVDERLCRCADLKTFSSVSFISMLQCGIPANASSGEALRIATVTLPWLKHTQLLVNRNAAGHEVPPLQGEGESSAKQVYLPPFRGKPWRRSWERTKALCNYSAAHEPGKITLHRAYFVKMSLAMCAVSRQLVVRWGRSQMPFSSNGRYC